MASDRIVWVKAYSLSLAFFKVASNRSVMGEDIRCLLGILSDLAAPHRLGDDIQRLAPNTLHHPLLCRLAAHLHSAPLAPNTPRKQGRIPSLPQWLLHHVLHPHSCRLRWVPRGGSKGNCAGRLVSRNRKTVVPTHHCKGPSHSPCARQSSMICQASSSSRGSKAL